MKEGSFNYIDFEGYIAVKFRNEHVDTIYTTYTEKIFMDFLKYGILFAVAILLLHISGLDDVLFFCFVLSFGGFFVITIMAAFASIYQRSRIVIYKDGVVIPDITKNIGILTPPTRHAICYDELEDLRIGKEEIIFSTEGEVIEIPRKYVPQFSRLRKSLKKSYNGYINRKSQRNYNDELDEYLNYAQNYGFLVGWDIARFKREIANLHPGDEEFESLEKFLSHPYSSLGDLLVTSYSYGFFVDESFTVKEIVEGANHCLRRFRTEIVMGSDWEGERGLIKIENGIRTLAVPLHENKLFPLIKPLEIMGKINSILWDHGFMFLLRGSQGQDQEQEEEEIHEFLLVEEVIGEKLIEDGKLDFKRM